MENNVEFRWHLLLKFIYDKESVGYHCKFIMFNSSSKIMSLDVMKYFRVYLLTLFVSVGLFGGVVCADEPLSFTWAFFLKSDGGNVKSLSFKTPEPVDSGELFRIYLELYDKTYVYLYLFDSRNDLYLVFPPSGSFYNGDFPIGYRAYIPSGQEWFLLDKSIGTEQFYLLASPERLIELEKLTDRFLVTDDLVLKEQLRTELDNDIERISNASAFEDDSVEVSHGSRLGVTKPLQIVDAHRITATGGYAAILNMINK